MQRTEASWRRNDDWKSRYSKLYSTRRISLTKEEEPRHISFMNSESTPYTSLLAKIRTKTKNESPLSNTSEIPFFNTLLSPQSMSRTQSNNLGGNETLLLDMVRAQSREIQDKVQDEPLDLTRNNDDDNQSIDEACVHGLSFRMTERSISRSHVSRISTRRDMDIASILAFTTTTTPPIQLGIPAFKKAESTPREEIPRWSIRRAVCPVCSQKWRDRSSINNVKNSGLKRNSSYELPSVIAPAKLRTSITTGLVRRTPLAAMDDDTRVQSPLRSRSASWQLMRARRFRIPKPQMPPPEATAPPSITAPLAQRDLNTRVIRFLNDEEVKLNF